MVDFLVDGSISSLKGVGPKKETELKGAGIFSNKDLIGVFPKQYLDFSKVFSLNSAPLSISCCIKAFFGKVLFKRLTKNKFFMFYKVHLYDNFTQMEATYFTSRFNNLKFKCNEELLFFGQIKINKLGKKELVISNIKKDINTAGGIVPVYRKRGTISSTFLAKLTKQLVFDSKILAKETLPDYLLAKYTLCPLNFALRNIHFPQDEESLQKAKRRLFFEEILLLQTYLNKAKEDKIETTFNKIGNNFLEEFSKLLPFELTNAQKKAIFDCEQDISSGVSMRRLLQGDVGSGKTAVAACLIFCMVKYNKAQVAVMAPTEILARQHYENFLNLFKGKNINIELLCSSVKTSRKRLIFSAVESGIISVVVGTQSLLNENLKFNNLGLVITDEQHRFGVSQRARLANKGGAGAHILVMSATPIPRSLALILYADLDISVLDELPKGRQKVETFIVDSSKRTRVLEFIKKNVNEGHQAYIVCPLIENDEDTNNHLKSIFEYRKNLEKTDLKDLKVQILHGKMRGEEKQKIMLDFAERRINILISTTVIEVGIDVPNANVMLIENAERLGLSQLHQLRGRVGRGTAKSYCILISDSKAKETRKRLEILKDFYDGFLIAQKDLEQRGPGNLLGLEQHGFFKLKTRDFIKNMEDVLQARNLAKEVISKKYDQFIDFSQDLELFTKNNGETISL